MIAQRLGAAADGGLLAESRPLRSFAAREKAVALVRHARACALWRLFLDEDAWREVLALLRRCARELGDEGAIITMRQQCGHSEAQRACVAAFAAVVDARKAGC